MCERECHVSLRAVAVCKLLMVSNCCHDSDESDTSSPLTVTGSLITDLSEGKSADAGDAVN